MGEVPAIIWPLAASAVTVAARLRARTRNGQDAAGRESLTQ
jgi:hypothetical protein